VCIYLERRVVVIPSWFELVFI